MFPDWWNAENDEYGVLCKLVLARDAVRRRPGMYVGGTDLRAMHHTIYQVLDSAVEEAMLGECTEIQVTLLPDGSASICDNSQGLPLDIHEQSKKSKLELLFTQLHMYKETLFAREYLPITGGLHGLGLCAINMLSEWMVVEVARDGYVWQQRYETGVPRYPLKQLRPLKSSESSGTTITVKPDSTIFVDYPQFEYERVARRCREIAYQIAGLTVIVRDEREIPHREQSYYYELGLLSFIDELRTKAEAFHDIIHLQTTLHIPEQTETNQKAYSLWLEFAFQFSDQTEDVEVGFVNSVQMPDGGTHVDAVRHGIVRGLNQYLTNSHDLIDSMNDTLGLISAVSVRLAEPKFESPTKVKLMNREIISEIERLIAEKIAILATAHPDQMQRIIEHCIANRAARSG